MHDETARVSGIRVEVLHHLLIGVLNVNCEYNKSEVYIEFQAFLLTQKY